MAENREYYSSDHPTTQAATDYDPAQSSGAGYSQDSEYAASGYAYPPSQSGDGTGEEQYSPDGQHHAQAIGDYRLQYPRESRPGTETTHPQASHEHSAPDASSAGAQPTHRSVHFGEGTTTYHEPPETHQGVEPGELWLPEPLRTEPRGMSLGQYSRMVSGDSPSTTGGGRRKSRSQPRPPEFSSAGRHEFTLAPQGMYTRRRGDDEEDPREAAASAEAKLKARALQNMRG
ncbi:hypothetical protein I317_07050 [Kwoniella heveanensis CBS 569]|nr:hypothetical protein I317_07050 [Kwoniella heveanensis CBS 569]